MMDSSTQTYDEDEEQHQHTPRVQIDTSPPFGSVEEAVIRFGGRGFWDPNSNTHTPPPPTLHSEFDICKLEEHAAEMLKDVDTKHQQTLNLLKELELTKQIIQHLKLKLINQSSKEMDRKIKSPVGISREVKQAKMNLIQSSNDLEAIRASVEFVNKEMDTKIEPPIGISRELRELNFEAEQFMKTAEAAKAEVLRAMSEIEQTKTGLRMIQMRWVAAKKLEEAAKATEALAVAEMNAALSTPQRIFQQNPGRISLSFDEYLSLAEKAGKFRAGGTHQTSQPPSNNNPCRVEKSGSKPGLRPSTSIGDILSNKLVLRDDLDVGRCEDRERVSLNQMLHRNRGDSSPPPGRGERNNGGDSKGLFSRRKNLGFVHISLPISRQSKNRIQALNLW